MTKEKSQRCEHEVQIKGMNFFRLRQCKKTAVVERSGKWFCQIHDPIQVNKRQTQAKLKKEKTRKEDTNLYVAYLIAKYKRKKKK